MKKETNNIAAAAFLLAFSVLLSRLFGYGREVLLAWNFGAGAETDAFYAAFQIPDLLNYFLSGGALSIAFIPLYNKVFARDGSAAANRLAAIVLGTMGVVVTVATAVLFIFAEPFIRLQFPRFDEETLALTVELTRIVLPAQIFFITGGIIQAVLMARRHFGAAAVAPLVYNIAIILGGLFLSGAYGIKGFAIGTLFGAILGPFAAPLLSSLKVFPVQFAVAFRDKRFLTYLVIAAPLMLGQTLLTLDEWYGRWFGALLGEGAVAHLSYARKLMQLPIAVIGQAVAAAALPTLSKLWAEGRVDELNALMQRTLQTVLALAVLMAGAVIILAPPGIVFVYQHGAFTLKDSVVVTPLTMIFALAIPGWVMQQIAVRTFYARGDTWRPMVLGTALSVAAIPLYYGLSKTMGVWGIAVAGAAGMSLCAMATLVYARKRYGNPMLFGLLKTFLKSVLICLPAMFAAYVGVMVAHEYLPLEKTGSSMGALKLRAFIDLCCGGLAFLAVATPALCYSEKIGLRDIFKRRQSV